MKSLPFAFLLAWTINSASSQATSDSVTLSVIGRFVVPMDTVGYAVTIGFNDSHQLVNEKYQSVTIPQFVTLYKKKLAAAGIDSLILKHHLDVFVSTAMEKRFVFKHENARIVENAAQIAIAMDIPVYDYDVVYKEQTLVSQYVKATLALNDAEAKAKIIADHLHMKIVKIINIDDQTSDRIINTGKPHADRLKAEYESFVRELEIVVSTGWSDIYTLKVKFLLVKK